MRRRRRLRKSSADDRRECLSRLNWMRRGTLAMRGKRIIAIGAVTLILACVSSSQGFGWTLVNAKIRHDFPQVRRITTAELAAWLKDEKRVPPLLLDVRTRAEFEVSHLKNARHVEPDASVDAIQERKDRPIVTYCSVGYRSGAFAEKLRVAGFTNVVNLEGSIFKWANEDRPIFRNGQGVEKVHPFNGAWGLLLQKKYRAKVAPVDR